MRRAPSCLLFAGILLSLGSVVPDRAAAEARARHSTPIPAPVHDLTGPQSRDVTGRDHAMVFGHRRGDRGFHSGLHDRGLPFGRHGFFPYGPLSWPYVDTMGAEVPMIGEDGAIPPPPERLTGIPSVADLPASTGIVSGPGASPTIYVLNGTKHSLRRGGGAKIVTMDEADPQNGLSTGAARIIHLDVSGGR